MIARGARRLDLVALLGATLVWPMGASADGITSEQADAMLTELREIRTLLEEQRANQAAPAAQPSGPPGTTQVSIAGNYAMGKADAPLTLVEFADYQCPFCTKFHTTSFEELKKNYIDTGLVRFVARDLPLPFHGEAMNAARSARCAGDQGEDAYWRMRHLLLVNSNALSRESMLAHAKDLSLNMKRFTACLDSEKYKAEVERDVADAGTAGLSGTPSFVLGSASGQTIKGVTIIGAQPYAAFETQIKQLLPADP